MKALSLNCGLIYSYPKPYSKFAIGHGQWIRGHWQKITGYRKSTAQPASGLAERHWPDVGRIARTGESFRNSVKSYVEVFGCVAVLFHAPCMARSARFHSRCDPRRDCETTFLRVKRRRCV